MAMKPVNGYTVKASKGSVWKGGAAPGPVAATTIGTGKQGPGAGKSSKAGKGVSKTK